MTPATMTAPQKIDEQLWRDRLTGTTNDRDLPQSLHATGKTGFYCLGDVPYLAFGASRIPIKDDEERQLGVGILAGQHAVTRDDVAYLRSLASTLTTDPRAVQIMTNIEWGTVPFRVNDANNNTTGNSVNS
jgi:hypothetical protein